MAIGTSKVGALGGLVPGGTATFNASGTFCVPPGVKKVSIEGVGGAGNPGNPGNPGNAGNPGNGGSGGAGGGGNNIPQYGNDGGVAVIAPGVLNTARNSFNPTQNNVQTPFMTRRAFSVNFFQATGGNVGDGNTQAGAAGTSGSGGSAGSAGNPGNTGQSSSGLGNTFPGGAGGNAGAAGNAGNGGTGGTGGGAGGNLTQGGGGGGGGNGGGNGGPGSNPQTINPGTYLGGGGGGGAGLNTNGCPFKAGTANLSPPPGVNKAANSYGGAGGTGDFAWPVVFNVSPSNNTRPGIGWWGGGSPGGVLGVSVGNAGDPYYVPGGTPNGATQGVPTSFGGIAQNPRVSNNVYSEGATFGSQIAPGGVPGNAWWRAGAGGGAGVSGPAFGAGGGGGGGRGNVGNAGGAGGAGGTGAAGTPTTFNCVPVTPGCSYPITVACGGSVTISWNPQ